MNLLRIEDMGTLPQFRGGDQERKCPGSEKNHDREQKRSSKCFKRMTRDVFLKKLPLKIFRFWDAGLQMYGFRTYVVLKIDLYL